MPKEQKTRAQMDARFLWKLEDIYPAQVRGGIVSFYSWGNY